MTTSHKTSPLLLDATSGAQLARWLHDNSQRRHGPLVCFDCRELPADLLEATLVVFGAAPTYATTRSGTDGCVQRAHGGTLCLEHIESLARPLQRALVRLLRTGTVRLVGSTQPQPSDVRLLATTGLDLTQEVRARRFCAELFSLLVAAEFDLPPAELHTSHRGAFQYSARHLLALATARLAEGSDTTLARTRPTALVIDDDTLLSQSLVNVLSSAGYHALAVDSASGALEIAESVPVAPLALIVDIMLPDGRGPELAAMLRDRFPGSRIVFITGYVHVDGHTLGLTFDAAFLRKPFAASDLIRAVGAVA